MTNNPINRPVALVTGGTRGIGFSCAEHLAKAGHDLALNGVRNEDQVLDTLSQLKEHGIDAIYCQGDISSSDDRTQIIDRIRSHYGRLNVLVNNAGVAPKERRDILEMTEESFDYVIGTNLKGTFFLAQLAANWMVEQARTDSKFSGCVINISSISATIASINRAEYCIAKSGLSMITILFASRLGEHGISVYDVRPGVTKTDMTSAAEVTSKYDELIKEGLCIQPRWGKPEAVGKAIAALARGDFSYSSGQTFTIDGGLTVPRL